MFKIKPPVKVITPQIPDGSITEEKLADGAVTESKLGFHLYEHTVATLDHGTFKLLNTDPTEYKQVKDLPTFEDVQMDCQVFTSSPATVAVSVSRTTKISNLKIMMLQIEDGDFTNTYEEPYDYNAYVVDKVKQIF